MIMSFDQTQHSFPRGHEAEDENSRRPSSATTVGDGISGDDEEEEHGNRDVAANDMLFAGMGNIAAACDAANAANRKPYQTEEAKQEGRRNANRRSAKTSRDRKKMESDQLQGLSSQLAQSNLALMKENQELRQQIAGLLNRQSNVDKSANLGGPMMGGVGKTQQDLLALQQLIQHQQTRFSDQQRSATAFSMASQLGLQGLMAPQALMQGSQLANETLQLAAATRSQQNHLGLNTTDNAGFDPREMARMLDRNKRQRQNPNDFM